MNLSIPLTSLKFQRDAILAADYFGLQYLYASGYDPESMLRFLERVPITPARNRPPPKTFNPYSLLEDRVRAMRKEIQQILPPRDTATISTSEFEAMQEHLRLVLFLDRAQARTAKGKPTLRRPGEIAF